MNKTIQQVDADIFTAIAHPVRRELLDRLLQGDVSVTELARPFDMSRPAISQHLRILRDVGLVTEQRNGRERHYRLQPDQLYEIQLWIQKYDRFWQNRLEQLGKYLEQHSDKKQ